MWIIFIHSESCWIGQENLTMEINTLVWFWNKSYTRGLILTQVQGCAHTGPSFQQWGYCGPSWLLWVGLLSHLCTLPQPDQMALASIFPFHLKEKCTQMKKQFYMLYLHFHPSLNSTKKMSWSNTHYSQEACPAPVCPACCGWTTLLGNPLCSPSCGPHRPRASVLGPVKAHSGKTKKMTWLWIPFHSFKHLWKSWNFLCRVIPTWPYFNFVNYWSNWKSVQCIHWNHQDQLSSCITRDYLTFSFVSSSATLVTRCVTSVSLSPYAIASSPSVA